MKPIVIKIIYDLEGFNSGVELWQGDEHITILLTKSLERKTGYRWHELKQAIDKLVEKEYKKI